MSHRSLPNTDVPAEPIEVTIEKILPKGLGLAFARGLTLLVSLASPGDRLRVRIREIKGNTAFAEIEEVLERGPNRTDPPCPYFGVCGGCDFQQMDYRTQVASKVDIIKDALKRIGRLEFKEINAIPSPREFTYRSRAQWHIDRRLRRIGYYQRNSNYVVDIDVCPKLTEDLQAGFQSFKNSIDWEDLPADKIHVDACVGDSGTVSVHSGQLPLRTDEVRFTSQHNVYFYSARSFFQGNHFLVGDLIAAAVGGAQGQTALDLYSGVGLFTLPLARRFKEVRSIEGNPDSVDFAEKNARRAGLRNISFIRRFVGHSMKEMPDAKFDLVLLDPPRSGTEKGVIQAIIKLYPKQVSYVACDPSILARDLRRLVDGGYKIDAITAIDLFPQTHHVETVARLSQV